MVQTYIDSRNLVCDVSTIFRIDSGRKGHTKNLSLEGNCALFVGCILLLNEVALSMLPQICSVECPYSIFVFFLKKKLPRFKGVVQSWLNGGKRSHEDGEKGLSLDYKLLYSNTFVKCYIHREIPK